LGGSKGRTLVLKAGDVAILPAGTGHQCLKTSEDFLVVGASPSSGTYDVCTSQEDRMKALSAIPKLEPPRKDPVYGAGGPLMRAWRKPAQPEEAAWGIGSGGRIDSSEVDPRDASAVARLAPRIRAAQRAARRQSFRAKAYSRAADNLLTLGLSHLQESDLPSS
jgi:hypothetical protein